MPATRVLIIGCGIAGPILAIFLKRKGYDPVVFERLGGVQDAGLGLMLQPNGLKVLSLVPGLLDSLFSSENVGIRIQRIGFFSLISDPPSTLGTIEDVSSKFTQRYGQGMFGVRRAAFQQFLVDRAVKEGVDIRWGWQLDGLEEVGDEVVATFATGEKEKGSFVIGCDGLHSDTRIALFGNECPQYSGVAHIGGIAPTPNVLKEIPTLTNISHIKNFMVTYPFSATHSLWAISNAEPEAKESWRAIDAKAQEEFKASALSEWGLGAGELVKGSEKIIKYGLYDRPQLSTWYKGRVVLLGDAAHPGTPHLGQGANQALEDIYHLVLNLTKNQSSPSVPPPTAELAAAFAAYESIRLPRSTEFVRNARRRGVSRVQASEEAVRERDETMRRLYKEESVEERLVEYDDIGKYPFDGESELRL